MGFKFLFLLSFVILVHISCKNQNKDLTTFTGPFPKRAINFTNVAGDSIAFEQIRYLIPEGKQIDIENIVFDSIIDTLVYKIFFEPKTRYNLVINQCGDTIYYGLISRYRGLFFCSTKVNDTTWHIGAFKMRGGYFEGFTDIRFQPWFVHQYINNHRDNKMIVVADTTTPAFRLKPNKKELLPIFKFYMTNAVKNKIVDNNSNPEIENLLEKPSKADLIKGYQITEDSLIDDFYPNPAIDFVCIKFFTPGDYTAHFIHSSGKKMKNIALHSITEKILVSDLDPGLYVVKIYSETSRCFETKKLIVKP